jgi:hypothetical protein
MVDLYESRSFTTSVTNSTMSKRVQPGAAELKVDSLLDLLESQDEPMRELFAKTLNLFVCPGAEDLDDRVKEDQLKKAIEDSLK